jgi:hypothetical protein
VLQASTTHWGVSGRVAAHRTELLAALRDVLGLHGRDVNALKLFAACSSSSTDGERGETWQ